MQYSFIFENWRKFLNEQEVPLTPEQNQAIKKLYVIIRDEALNIKKFLLEKHPELFKDQKIDANDPKIKTLPGLIRRGYTPTENFKKDINGFVLKNANLFTPFLKEMDQNFTIKFFNDPKMLAAIEGGNLRLNPLGLFMSSELNFKSILQHELEHLVHGEEAGERIERGEGDSEFYNSVVRYLGGLGEIHAHAKQFAYVYYKTFPQDSSVDIKKLQSVVSKELPDYKGTVESYLLHFAGSTEVSSHYREKEKELAKKASEKFIYQINWYFNNYKQK